MDSTWDQQPDSPEVKYEPTSVDSFLSPPPQFPSTSSTTPATDALAAYTLTPGLPDSEELSPAPEAEKKPVKKRKSWGQVLPEPKTNLPPRKRAKTEDEKEQRRVERVLRNRRAAQSSRERKRQEVEALERRTKDLEAMLLNAQRVNGILIAHIRNTEGSLPPDLTASKPLPTLSNSIFQSSTESLDNSVNDLASFQQETLTVDPASLSPIPEDPTTTDPEQSMSTPAPEFLAPPAASSVDLTQRPAEMLCDLQCQSTEMPRSWLATQSQNPAIRSLLQCLALISCVISTMQGPVTQIAISLKTGCSLPPSPALLQTMIWFVTRPSRQQTSTSTSSSTMSSLAAGLMAPWATSPLSRTQTRSSASPTSPSLRLKSLKKILTCSPNLARPLADATMAALRLVSSEGREHRALGLGEARDLGLGPADSSEWLPNGWSVSYPLPPREALLTLLWALRVEEKKSRRQELISKSAVSEPGGSVPLTMTPPVNIFPCVSKRKAADVPEFGEKKRRAW